ncbi:hypothetical protein DMB37_34940 [Nocardia sp. CS682]|nr:hypothetical protein DMB37_34940 [Nocardia sp. CS682]
MTATVQTAAAPPPPPPPPPPMCEFQPPPPPPPPLPPATTTSMCVIPSGTVQVRVPLVEVFDSQGLSAAAADAEKHTGIEATTARAITGVTPRAMTRNRYESTVREPVVLITNLL